MTGLRTTPAPSDWPGRLFRHYNTGTRFRKSHISRWLVETILLTYKHSNQEAWKLDGVSGHQVRSMAASWAYYKDTPLTEIRKSSRLEVFIGLRPALPARRRLRRLTRIHQSTGGGSRSSAHAVMRVLIGYQYKTSSCICPIKSLCHPPRL